MNTTIFTETAATAKTTRTLAHPLPSILALATLVTSPAATLSGANQPITLRSPSPGQIEVTGPAGQAYWLEATSDFDLWTLLARRTLTNGLDAVEDPPTGTATQRFYRALPQILTVVASNLWSPTKLILTPGGSGVVAEAGTSANTGRITIINPAAESRSILTGLPSGRMPPENAASGPAGLVLISNTLYIAIGAGDSTVNGSSPGQEAINPSPSSPLFSSILQCAFDRPIEDLTATFAPTALQFVF